MDGKKSAAAGGVVAVLVGGASVLGDDVIRALRSSGDDIARRAPAAAPSVYDALHDPSVPAALKSGISTFRDLRKGTAEEKVMAKAGCAVMNSAYRSTRTEYEDRVKQAAATDLPDFVVDRYAPRIATALAVADDSGGAARWYVQYCVFSR